MFDYSKKTAIEIILQVHLRHFARSTRAVVIEYMYFKFLTRGRYSKTQRFLMMESIPAVIKAVPTVKWRQMKV